MSDDAKRQRKRVPMDAPNLAGFNPKTGYWAEGEEGRKSGSKVPAAKRKAKRRRKP
jgi:hypothetical protein